MGGAESTGPKAYKLRMKQEYLLGEGGYGQVFRVTRRSDKAPFALKISLKTIDFQGPKDLLNDKTERRVQQLIQHPFTVKIIDEFIIDNK